ncbi:ABC transporter permease [Actinopolymorpha alba]|uniref:ABC transporter permease n=1 Tax=Actinopolymorpha alba TaxID=533267 RepID=UPI00037BBD2D|nr:ABC transporter permease [Actinopolymorpha alba]
MSERSIQHNASAALVQAGNLTLREVRALMRQPFYIAVTLVQPMVWLLLFGQLFKRVVEIPGFGGGSYIGFMTPGIVVMTALFASAWTGMGLIDDMERGVMNRLLVSPTKRGAILTGKLAHIAVSLAVQALIVVLVGVALGARYDGGVIGVLMTIVAAVLLAIGFGSFSCTVALLVRQRESLIAVAQFFTLPLSFLSSALVAESVAPGWIRSVARFNPVDWAVSVSRGALSADPDWGDVLAHCGYLVIMAGVLAWLATRAFTAYRRSV